MTGKNACHTGMKNNEVKKILIKQHCLCCGRPMGFWARIISAEQSLCDECLHHLQRDSREACRQAEGPNDKKAG